VVTEAGFGADLGAEKFIDIKCRKSGPAPAAAVLVATMRALKFHGGVKWPSWARKTWRAGAGMANLSATCTTCARSTACPAWWRSTTSPATPTPNIALLRERIEAARRRGGAHARHWARAAGAGTGAHGGATVRAAQHAALRAYEDSDPLWDKMRKLATKIYGADMRCLRPCAQADRALQDEGYGHYPVCVAKTQYSFSTDANAKRRPQRPHLNVREVRLAAGAEFVVMVCGDIMTMPGLPKVPAAERIDIDEQGRITSRSWALRWVRVPPGSRQRSAPPHRPCVRSW
jgi:formate--tetrahydrofolate ligase